LSGKVKIYNLIFISFNIIVFVLYLQSLKAKYFLRRNIKIVDKETEMSAHWQQLIAGDLDTFAFIYEHYVDVLYNYGYHFVEDSDLVQDAIQDLFIDILHKHKNLSETSSVKYYLFRSLRRRLHIMVESNGKFDNIYENDNAFIDENKSPETAIIEHETENSQLIALQKYISQLPPRQAEAIRLRFYDDFTLEEVASIMQMNEQSVRNLIHRSIKTLRQFFGPLLGLFICLKEIF